MTITGGCRCGSVRYRIEASPDVLPDLRHADVHSSRYAKPYIGMRAGTLDEPDLGKPEITIWTSSAPSWACFDPDLPRECEGSKLDRGAKRMNELPELLPGTPHDFRKKTKPTED